MDILIVGAGLSGATCARVLADAGHHVRVIEKRNHIAGNCYDYRSNGILTNAYGAHLFHTESKRVWEFVLRFSQWVPYEHRVVSHIGKKHVPLPINISTLNETLGLHLKDGAEMKEYLENEVLPLDSPRNAEEQLWSTVGRNITDIFFRYYTQKQWNCELRDLDAAVVKRIPVRYNFDTRYFSDRYQALPKHGYTEMVRNMLADVEVELNKDYFEVNEDYDHLIFTGPIDRFFDADHLSYRSLRFEKSIFPTTRYFQPHPVVNYPGHEAFTRILEYKHFPVKHTVEPTYTEIFKEYPSDTGEPYYPVFTEENQSLYAKLQEKAKKLEKVHLVGRLANFKYFNMDQAILNALEFCDNFLQAK